MNQINSLTRTRRSLLIHVSAAFGAVALLPNAALRQAPAIIVPQTPGTGPDILVRVIGSELQQGSDSRSSLKTYLAQAATLELKRLPMRHPTEIHY
jgi:hypothetical protein